MRIITKSEKGRAGSLTDKGIGGHTHGGIWTVGILDIEGVRHLAGGFAEKTTV